MAVGVFTLIVVVALVVFVALGLGLLGFIFGLLAYKKASGLEKRVKSLESSNEK